MRTLAQIVLAIAILASGWLAVKEIARTRNEAAAGPDVFVLDDHHPRERAAWTRLITRLRQVDQDDLANALERLRAEQRLWIAPRLPSGRRAVYVSTLGLVRRVYVGGRTLVEPPATLYPELHVPADYADAYAFIALAGTLQHELTHASGIESEAETYAREIAWYGSLKQTRWYASLTDDERTVQDFAIDLALRAAEKARAIAGAS
jgi:hypothetical protein